MVQKTILSFWVCVTWCHSGKPFLCKRAMPGWWHITLQPGFIVPLETSWNIVSFITPLASHELQEHGDIPWQSQATSWKWVKNHPPGGVKLEYANGVEVRHGWHVRKFGASPSPQMFCSESILRQHVSHTHASSEKVGSDSYLFRSYRGG